MPLDDLCAACGEAPIDPEAQKHGYDFCDVCRKTDSCFKCDRGHVEEHDVWEEGLCYRCEAEEAKHTEAAEWQQAFAKEALALGLTGKDLEYWAEYGGSGAGSHYIKINGWNVRVSDHISTGSYQGQEHTSVYVEYGGYNAMTPENAAAYVADQIFDMEEEE